MSRKAEREARKVSLLLEDAEIRILDVCKATVLQRKSRSRFDSEVNKIISEAVKELPKDISERIARALKAYSYKTLDGEYRLIKNIAIFYSAVAFSMKNKQQIPLARRYEAKLKSDLSPELLKSAGFKSMVRERELSYTSYNDALPLAAYHKEYTYAVRDLTRDLILGDAKEDYSTNVNIRNIAEMSLRYEGQLDMIDGLVKKGVKLVYIEPHANCSKRCEPYQVGGSLHPSGLYSLDGTDGYTPDGVKYLPLSFATDNPRDRYTTKAHVSYQNGCIKGFNCRHRLIPYKPGAPPPISIPGSVIKKRREVEHKQREYEREIRYQKRLGFQAKGINNEIASSARKKAKELNEQYMSFCKQNNVAFYRERTRIFEDEKNFELRKSDIKRLKN